MSDVLTLSGPLAERDRWTVAGWCPMERALELIGTRSAMVLLREAFFGARRFDDLVRRAGVTEPIAAKRLKQLVDAGVLERRPYREAGHRTRHEYVLTEQGRGLFPVLAALMSFGDLLPKEQPGSIELVHADCGAAVSPHVRCAAGHDVPLRETVARIAHNEQISATAQR